MCDDAGIMEQIREMGPVVEAREFLEAIGLEPNPDAVDQLARVFVPCLKIMCEREHAGDGSTWKRSGWKAQLHEVFKKVERIRERCWLHSLKDGGKETFDAINYLGMFCRGQMDDLSAWAEWGKPGD